MKMSSVKHEWNISEIWTFVKRRSILCFVHFEIAPSIMWVSVYQRQFVSEGTATIHTPSLGRYNICVLYIFTYILELVSPHDFTHVMFGTMFALNDLGKYDKHENAVTA